MKLEMGRGEGWGGRGQDEMMSVSLVWCAISYFVPTVIIAWAIIAAGRK